MRLVLISLLMITSAGNATPPRETRIEQAKQTLAADLKDPDSAKFRNVREHRNNVCGEYNAKNSYGGYVGFERFIQLPGEKPRLDDSGPAFETAWKEGCTDWVQAEPAPFYEKSAEDIKSWAK